METTVISIERKPFTSECREGCGWYVTVVFTLKDEVYKNRLTKLIELEELFITYTSNYIFTFHQCVTETPTTLGAIQELENIRDGIISDKYISPVERYIVHAIQTLDLYWD